MRLQGKSVVVTGASSGMGKAMVELFVQNGANVVAAARRKERLDELTAALADRAGKVIAFPGDVTKQEDNEAMIDLAVREFGKLDGLVNNAGIMDDMGPIGDLTNEKLMQVYSVNVFGPIYAMRKAVNVFLKQQSGGSIVNVASLGCKKPVAGPAYCSSKAAIVSVTKNTAFMYMPDKIRCNAIAPGAIQTEISNSMGMPNQTGYGRVQKVLATSPGLGTAQDVAAAALFFISDESKFISGDVMFVDGGWNAG